MRFVPLQLHRLASIARRRAGFTLIEAAMTTAIIGLGVVAMMQLLAAGTMSNAASAELTTATNLAGSINEWSLRTTFADKTFSPPRDALGASLTDFGAWRQIVDVHYVDPNRVTLAVPDTQPEPTSRVVVTITRNNRMILTTTFLRCSSQWPLP